MQNYPNPELCFAVLLLPRVSLEVQSGDSTADPTVPPLSEEEGEVAAEPEDPPTELLRRVLAGSREPDVSRVKLAKMPAPTRSQSLPPAKAWQDWFTIRLRAWTSPEFETELVKKGSGQPADLAQRTDSLRARSA